LLPGQKRTLPNARAIVHKLEEKKTALTDKEEDEEEEMDVDDVDPEIQLNGSVGRINRRINRPVMSSDTEDENDAGAHAPFDKIKHNHHDDDPSDIVVKSVVTCRDADGTVGVEEVPELEDEFLSLSPPPPPPAAAHSGSCSDSGALLIQSVKAVESALSAVTLAVNLDAVISPGNNRLVPTVPGNYRTGTVQGYRYYLYRYLVIIWYRYSYSVIL
jgi:hypothetical protein